MGLGNNRVSLIFGNGHYPDWLEAELDRRGLATRYYDLSEAIPIEGLFEPLPVIVVILDKDGEVTPTERIVGELNSRSEYSSTPLICSGFTPSAVLPEGERFMAPNFCTSRNTGRNAFLDTIESAYESAMQYNSLLNDLSNRESAFGLITSGTFELRTLKQAESLSTMLSRASPHSQITALAVMELLVNAIEHGNLSISYAEKSKFLEEGNWIEEVERRLNLPENREKQVQVKFRRLDHGVVFEIRDCGDGFEWEKYLSPNADMPEEIMNGRGILLAASVECAELAYHGKGNVARLKVLDSTD